MGDPAEKTEPFRRGTLTVRVRNSRAGRTLLQDFVRKSRSLGLVAAARLEEVFPEATPGEKFAGLWTLEMHGAVNTLAKILRGLEGVETVHEAPARGTGAR